MEAYVFFHHSLKNGGLLLSCGVTPQDATDKYQESLIPAQG